MGDFAMKELIFNTRKDFDEWHEQVKTEKGYPQINFNASNKIYSLGF